MTACCAKPSACCDKTKTKVDTACSIALVGNPNCGKTTLFNALTGARQRVGNWPGVTVERKSGYFTENGMTVEVVDLPGVYSLTLATDTAAVDECIACEYVLRHNADVVVNVVDASNLERHFYLTLQLLEMGVPVIVALNMVDVAKARGIYIDTAKLARELGCPVIALEGDKQAGLACLRQRVLRQQRARITSPSLCLPYPTAIQQAITRLKTANDDKAWRAVRLLEDDAYLRQLAPATLLDRVEQEKQTIQSALHEDADILIADTRYRYIQGLLSRCLFRSDFTRKTWTNRIDQIVLNRVLGVPIFLGVMYLLFLFAINIGGAFQDFFDISSQTIFVDGFAWLLNQVGSPAWLTALLANGFGKGINTTLTFIPVIGALFLFLSFLEDSGYMARAAFVIDRFMRMLGLPGKAFVPMIVGFGCNVPAVMAARTLENKRDRILTIMMSPFMSCGARLAIYAVFTTAFFPQGGQNVVFALYLIGILMAILTGFILRHTLLKGEPSPLVMELPIYHVPQLKSLLLHAWQRLKGFVFRAGKLIVPICMLIGVLNSLHLDGTLSAGDADAHSLLSMVGQWVTPIFAPMGVHADNWPATVGLVTGVLAKEVVVGTLNTLYAQLGHASPLLNGEALHFWANLKAAVLSIPVNFVQLGEAFSNPVLAKAPIHALDQTAYGLMYQRFDGQVGAFAYLLFVLLYFPCVSTTAAMLREVHRGWSVFSIVWMTGVAYGVAVLFYQSATWMRHPVASSLWIVGIVVAFVGTIGLIRWSAAPRSAGHLHIGDNQPVGEVV